MSRKFRFKLTTREMVLFSVLGTIMLLSKLMMESLPNIHLLGTLTVVYTLCYRGKALIPIYIYVFLNGLLFGFNMWWVPYLYIWTLLWGAVMLLPKGMPTRVQFFVYIAVSGVHGFLFGTLYAPAQAIMFGLNFEATIAWIVAGLGFDMIHGIGNILLGTLILPLCRALRSVEI